MNSPLDQLSTSQTKFRNGKSKKYVSDKSVFDRCQNNAPCFAYQISGSKWGVVQGCCNDWNCPRCGQQRAREEYGRIVQGAREIGKNNKLYMLTITCLGKEMSVKDAEDGYLIWTNKLLTRLRTESKRANKEWSYASVTERQTRQHPHSHYLTTYCPADAIFIAKGEPKNYCTSAEVFPAKHDTLQSYKLEQSCVDAGLGRQYDISELSSVEGASRYVAKYLFKESIFNTVWPKGWRRVRYSQNWPKLPEREGNSFCIRNSFDWFKLGQIASVLAVRDGATKQIAEMHLRDTDVIIQ